MEAPCFLIFKCKAPSAAPHQGTACWGSSQSPYSPFLPSFPASETAISFLLLHSYQDLCLNLCLRIWGGGRELQGTQHGQCLKVAYLLPLPTSPVATHHFLTLNLSVAAGLFSDFRGLTFQLRLKDLLRSPSLFTLSPSVSPFPFQTLWDGCEAGKVCSKIKKEGSLPQTRRGLTLLSQLCRDPAVGVRNGEIGRASCRERV